jgi:hypothetical protein
MSKKRIEHTNKYAEKFQSKIMQWLLHRFLVGIGVHWVFQGLLYMDLTERRFKLMLDVILTVVGGIILSRWLPWPLGGLIAFLIAHTLNFLFNAQLWVVLKHYGLVSHTYETFENYTRDIAKRINAEPSLMYAAVYGSRVRAAWRPSSDLDIRLVRGYGWKNGVRACSFVLIERTRAFWRGFPLDIYVLDSFVPLSRLRADEPPLVLLDNRAKS